MNTSWGRKKGQTEMSQKNTKKDGRAGWLKKHWKGELCLDELSNNNHPRTLQGLFQQRQNKQFPWAGERLLQLCQRSAGPGPQAVFPSSLNDSLLLQFPRNIRK